MAIKKVELCCPPFIRAILSIEFGFPHPTTPASANDGHRLQCYAEVYEVRTCSTLKVCFGLLWFALVCSGSLRHPLASSGILSYVSMYVYATYLMFMLCHAGPFYATYLPIPMLR